MYLDVFWDEEGVHVEIHGAHHYAGLAPVDDAVRANDLAIRGTAAIALVVPVLGLRIPGDQPPHLDFVTTTRKVWRRTGSGS